MPELPEVETIKRGLAKNIIGKKIADFDCDWPKMINLPLAQYKKKIIGLKIKKLRRRSKMLIIDLSQNWHIVVHLKMTGQLVYSSGKNCLIGGHSIKQGFACLPNKFTHARFRFSDQSYLYFNDIRKFGWLRLFGDQELQEYLDELKLGPEPLSPQFTLAYLQAQMKKRPKLKIKQFLMDLHNLVGVGNIYSDEVLFYAKIKPDKPVKNLKPSQVKMIYGGIRKILEKSIKLQGTTFSNYVNADGDAGSFSKMLKVYGRYDQPCKTCRTKIKKIKIGGRTSSYCPVCQK